VSLSKIMAERTYEPAPRLKDWFGHHGHRFAIKGGITRSEAWARNLTLNMVTSNPLLALLKRGSYSSL
jgi:hypothetical protein